MPGGKRKRNKNDPETDDEIHEIEKSKKRRKQIDLSTDAVYTGTLAFDPGESGLGWALVSYIGDENEYNNCLNYVIRDFGVITVIDHGHSLTDITRRLIEHLAYDEALSDYVMDRSIMKVIECQEGFDFKEQKRWRFFHQMVRMGCISGMLAGSLAMLGNDVRFMQKAEKWRQPINIGKNSIGTTKVLPMKGEERVCQVLEILHHQGNDRLIRKLRELGEELRPKAMDDASAAIVMAMENTRKMACATSGHWPPKSVKRTKKSNRDIIVIE
jgi:hypothetical protein